MKLSIIIPCWNERATIATVLDRVRTVPIEKEIIVVDGNSDDGTVEVLREQEKRGDVVVIYQPARNGRGMALRDGLARATGDAAVFQDADLELDPAELPRLLEPLARNEADVVLGSRFLQGKPRMTFLQYWGNRCVTITLNLLHGTHLTDVETCYQLFRPAAVKNEEFRCRHFTFTVEILIRFIKLKQRIVEVPVSYNPRTVEEGKKLYWKDGFESLWVIVKERF